MALPQKLNIDLMQTTWASQLNPILANPQLKGLILKNILLAIGINQIPHTLGRNLQGWIPTRVRAASNIYDSQDNNPTPQLTLSLISDAIAVVDIWVF